jgi:hypothetical protein
MDDQAVSRIARAFPHSMKTSCLVDSQTNYCVTSVRATAELDIWILHSNWRATLPACSAGPEVTRDATRSTPSTSLISPALLRVCGPAQTRLQMRERGIVRACPQIWQETALHTLQVFGAVCVPSHLSAPCAGQPWRLVVKLASLGIPACKLR